MPEGRRIPWGERGPDDPAGRGVPVYVIDSGVNPAHSHVRGVCGGVKLVKEHNGGIRCDDGDFEDEIGHGTAITAVIRHVAPAACIYAIKIFSGTLRAPVDVLEAGLAHALEGGARIVNLSLATDGALSAGAFEGLCRDAARRGVVLVASARNGAKGESAPASFADVIGVAGDGRLREDVVVYRRQAACECRASPWPRPLQGVPRWRNFHGSSFAAARVAGLVACLLEEFPGLDVEGVRRVLAERYGESARRYQRGATR